MEKRQMEYNLIIENYFSQKQIHVIISGEMDEKTRNEIIHETVRLMRMENIPNVLWDIRKAFVVYSLIGSHSIIEQIHRFGFISTDHAAVIYRNNENQHGHADNVAFNKNRHIKYFRDDIEEARKWLLQFEK
ncbi:MAG: hypothetical protein PHT07_14655 [Paludibacter sp.]|nr:hypothetical protein [Paludibacter sp.]